MYRVSNRMPASDGIDARLLRGGPKGVRRRKRASAVRAAPPRRCQRLHRCTRSPTAMLCRLYSRSRFADIGEIEIEDHCAAIHAIGEHQVRVHVAWYRLIMKFGYCQKYHARSPVARGGGRRIFDRGHHRARLQAVAIVVLDGVLPIIEHAVQGFVQVRHVVSAVEVVVDEHLPVALQAVRTSLEKMQRCQVQRRHARGQPAEKMRERLSVSDRG